MNAEDLKKLGLDDEEAIEKIIVLHGKDIEKHKTSLTTVQTELEGVRKQLGDANTQIDRLVYALYELTEAEIEIVEGG